VAGAVENLSYEDVNIIDTEGHVLSDGIKNQGNTATQLTQLELRKSFEKDLESRIEQLLESIYGTDKIVTMVTANLDFNQKEADRTIWGNQGVVASEQNSQTQTDTAGSSGLVGTASNVGSTPSTSAGASNANTNTSSTKNYEINKVEEKEIYAPGRVISISVAVAVDGNPSAAKTARIKNVVSAAIGFDSSRGDTINIMSANFNKSSLIEAKAEMAKADAAAKKQEQMDTWMSWGYKGAGVLAFLVIGFLLMRYLKPRDDWPELKIDQPISIKDVEEQMETTNYVSEDEKIKTILKNEPEVAVQIITSWLEENGGDKNS